MGHFSFLARNRVTTLRSEHFVGRGKINEEKEKKRGQYLSQAHRDH